jgi:DUF4097 and DUF4098 domain-containing protein YvlB
MPDSADLQQRNANTAPQKPVTNPVSTNPHRTYVDNAPGQPTRLIDAQPTGASASEFDRGNPTNSFYQPGGYNPPTPPPAMYTAQPPYYQPPTKSGAPWGWILAIGGIFLVGVIFLMALFIGRASRPPRRGGVPPPPPPPTAPPVPGRPSTTGVLSEDGAVVTASETTITQKFPLRSTAKFSLQNPSGNIIIDGTDSTTAEIKVIKSGGDADDRREVQIRYSTSGGNLVLETDMNDADDIEVTYQIKLPRSLGGVHVEAQSSDVELKNLDANIEIESQSGKVDLAKVQGAVTVDTQSGDIHVAQADSSVRVNSQSGDIELTGIKGAVQANSMSSTIRASFENAPSIDDMSFETVSGDVDLSFKADLNAELDAQTVSGAIDVKTLGVQVRKEPGHAEAVGTIGTGGQTLKIETVSGKIKVTKRS